MNHNETLDLKEFLERVQDDKELLLELLDIFVDDYQNKRKQLTDLIAANNCDEVKNIAHSLKGASGNISAKALRISFLKLEEMGKTGNLAGAENIIIDLDRQFQDFLVRVQVIKEEFKS